MTKDEALKMALEALEEIKQETFHPAKVFAHNHAITAILEALTQQQEPVVTKNEDGMTLHVGWDDLPVGAKLYTSPQAKPWVGLSDEDGIEYPHPPAKPPVYATASNTKAVRDGIEMGGYEKESGYYSEAQLDQFAQAIEAKLKEKNT